MSKAPFQLTNEILARSEAKTWQEARYEWELVEIYMVDEPETCLCGHFPILELCILQNKRNGTMATIGNVCVKRFLGLPSDALFRSIKRIRKDIDKSLSQETIAYAFAHGMITAWEKAFYTNILGKRSLTARQQSKKIEINKRVLQKIQRRRDETTETL